MVYFKNLINVNIEQIGSKMKARTQSSYVISAAIGCNC